jgi:hypothetical protein
MRSIRTTLVSTCGVLISIFALAPSASAQLAPGGSAYDPRVVPPFAPAYIVGGIPAGYTELPVSASYPTTTFNYNYIPGSVNEAYFGSVTSRVYKNNVNGTLAFSYKFNDLVPPNPPDNTVNFDINHVTIGDPSNPWVGVGILSEGADRLGVSTAVPGAFTATGWTDGDPFNIVRSATDSGIGAFFSLNGGTILNRGTAAAPLNNTSALIWVTTDATRFRLSNVGLQDSQSTVGTAQAYAPFVPEPSTMILAGLGCAAACGTAIRRRFGRRVTS